MKVKVLNLKTNRSTSQEVSDGIFDRNYNESLVHQITTAYMAAGRSGSKAQKNRAAVRGGGKKPWKQRELAAPVRAHHVDLFGEVEVLHLLLNLEVMPKK